MKRPYAESTLKRKLRETGIPKAALDKLHLYFVACANFYKVLSVDEVWKVIRRTERRLGKKEMDEILDQALMDSMRFYLVDEFHRKLEDDVLEQLGEEETSVPDSVLYDMIEEREEEYERHELRNIKKLAAVMLIPLTSDGFHFEDGDYDLTREDFEKYVAVRERACDRYFILQEDEIYEDGRADVRYLAQISSVVDVEDGEIIGMDLDEVADILDRSYEKPLFVPEDLFCYLNPLYYEETEQTEAMEKFLLKAFYQDEDDRERKLAVLGLMIQLNKIVRGVTVSPTDDIDQATKMLKEEGLILANFKQAEEFIQLLMDLSNHTRQPVNKGHTPDGLFKAEGTGMPSRIEFGPGIQDMLRSGEWDPVEMKRDLMTEASLPIELRGELMREVDRALEPGEERVINETGTIVKGRKIKPNEPCPCGSGRKYKHCCGRHS